MAQISDGGGGGKRESSFELNLVPFIDLMSVMITFLLITAVWTQVSMIKLGTSMHGKQDPGEPPPKPPPRADLAFRVDVKDSGYRVVIGQKKYQIGKLGGEYDRTNLLSRLKNIKVAYPDKVDCVVTMDEELKYDFLIQAMDALLEAGFPAISVATGGAR